MAEQELTGREEQARRLAETLRRQLGLVGCKALAEPGVFELMLNPDGSLWQDRSGVGMSLIGTMGASAAESFIGTVAATLRTTVTRDSPILECELPPDPPFLRARFAASIPPIVAAPEFAIRMRASTVITLAQYVEDGVMTPRQRAVIERAVRERKNILVVGGTTSGKAQPLSAQVLTPTGFRRIGDLAVGDLVTCPSGTSVPVQGVFPQGVKEIFRVTFEDGRTVECCADHLWKVWTRTSQYVLGAGRKGPKICGMGWQVVPLRQISEWFAKDRSLVARTAVPLVAPCAVELPPQSLPIAPYALGAFLGDGNLTNPTVVFSTQDQPILDRVLQELPDYTAVFRGGVDYRIRQKSLARVGGVTYPTSPLKAVIVTLGLFGLRSHEKFVPQMYKCGSVAQRLALLQGLLDTDGSVGTKGASATFSTTSKRLAHDVQEIAWSLGAVSRLVSRQTHFTNRFGIKTAGRLSYRVSIAHVDASLLFSLPRKAEAAQPRTYQSRLRIAKIEPVGSQEAVCISVGSADGLYVTDNFVVTHNTTLCNAILAYLAEVAPGHRLVVIEDTAELQTRSKNIVSFCATTNVTMQQLLKTTLRRRPDRIIVGEVRGGEALALLKAWNTGHPGGVCTIHANDARAGLIRIDQLIAETSIAPMHALIAEAVDLIVSIANTNAGRRVQEVVSVDGYENGAYQFTSQE